MNDTIESLEIPAEMTLPEALALAVRLQREDYLDAAETIYTRILAGAPGHPDALHFLGLIHHRRGDPARALELIREAIAAVPDFPDFHVNLGNILADSGEVDQAQQAFELALRLNPDCADASNNLGAIHRARDRDTEAERCFLRAIEADPRHVRAHNNLGLLYGDQGKIKDAVSYYCKSITLMPDNPDGYKLLGIAYYTLGKIDEAAEVFRQWLESEPDNPAARHMFAACSGIGVPERAGDDYVAYTFDRFAASFEDQLQTRLHYRAPELISQALAVRLPTPGRQLEVLDAGCGTGLCGPLLAPWAKRLTGVDLSGGMLNKAVAKGCYDALEQAELTAYLRDHPGAFDLVVSADTLCYFGSLHEVSLAAAGALRPGGRFAYTVERIVSPAEGEGFHITPSGRYAHARAHIEAALEAAGLQAESIAEAHLRTEGGVPVEGLVVLGRRAEH